MATDQAELLGFAGGGDAAGHALVQVGHRCERPRCERTLSHPRRALEDAAERSDEAVAVAGVEMDKLGCGPRHGPILLCQVLHSLPACGESCERWIPGTSPAMTAA